VERTHHMKKLLVLVVVLAVAAFAVSKLTEKNDEL
jgi:hypothetical protein